MVIFIAIFTIIVAVLAWLSNSNLSAQYSKCVYPSRITEGVVVVGKIVNFKEVADESFIKLELCEGDNQFISPSITIVSQSGFIVTAKKQGNGYFYGNERTNNFINSSGQLIAVRVDPVSLKKPEINNVTSAQTQNSLINQIRKKSPLHLFLPYIFSPPLLNGSVYLTAANLNDAQKVITENGL